MARPKPTDPVRVLGMVAVTVLLTVAFQPIEMPGREGGAGTAWLIRVSAVTALAIVALALQRFNVRSGIWLCALAASAVLLLVNARDLGQYAILLIVSCGASILAAMALSDKNRHFLAACLSMYLIFNVAGLLTAYIIVQLTGNFIDFHNMIFPYSEARLGLSYGVARVSGFHIEPGTYAQWMFIATFIRSLLIGRIFDRLVAAVIVTLLLTFSAWGVFALAAFGSAWLIGALRPAKKSGGFRPIVKMASVAFVFILAASIYNSPYANYIQNRFLLTDGSGISKIVAMDSLQHNIGNAIIFGEPISRPFCPNCVAPQDIGVWSSFVYHIGVIPSVMLISLVMLALMLRWGFAYIPLFMVVLLTKTLLLDPMVWFAFAVPIFALFRHRQTNRSALPLSPARRQAMGQPDAFDQNPYH